MRHSLSARRTMAAATTLILTVSMLVVSSGSGEAAPRQDLDQVQAQVRDLEMQAGAAHEEASRAADQLREVQGRLDAIQRRAQREREGLQQTQATMADLARMVYSTGGIDPMLQVLLADDPTEFLAQAAVMSQLAESQVAQIRQAQTNRLRLAQTEAEAAGQQALDRELRDQMTAAEDRVTQRLAEAQAVLANLQEAERRKLAELQAQRREEQARQASQAADAAREAQANNPTGGVSSGGSGGEDSGSGGSQQSGGGFSGGSRAAAAVQYALSRVGDPYSYSANPPSSWDCSKLTSAAWAQSGVGLTALSYTQWDQTQRVPVSDIQPGDLVFYFGSGAHHVAIYVGNGKMVSASNPSDGVELIDFLGPWYNERFSGVGRVIG